MLQNWFSMRWLLESIILMWVTTIPQVELYVLCVRRFSMQKSLFMLQQK